MHDPNDVGHSCQALSWYTGIDVQVVVVQGHRSTTLISGEILMRVISQICELCGTNDLNRQVFEPEYPPS